MRAIIKREIKNYLKRPLFWLGIMIVIMGVYNATAPYLETHYLSPGEKIHNDYPETIHSGDVYEGYIPAAEEQQRKIWNEKIRETLRLEFQMSEQEVQNIMEHMDKMEIEEACAYLEENYEFYSAGSEYEASAYYKGTWEEINAYLEQKLSEHAFSYYFARKFADFAGLYMGFFATVLLSVLFWNDTRKNNYELLHTKPVKSVNYILGKVGGGFGVCLFVLAILNLLFWVLCLVYTKDSGFEVRLWDFIKDTVLYILPNMLMIICVYMLVGLLFKNPLPGVPFLILYMLYSNLGGYNAKGEYGYYGRPLAIMVRFPGQLFDTAPPPLAMLNQSMLIIFSVFIIWISILLWKRRRM